MKKNVKTEEEAITFSGSFRSGSNVNKTPQKYTAFFPGFEMIFVILLS